MEDKSVCFLLALVFISHTYLLTAVRGQLLPIIDEASANGGWPGQLQTYIVHVREPEGLAFSQAGDRESWHRSFLPNITLASGEPRLVYSYREAISGFAARLTPEEAEAMKEMDGFLFARPEKMIVGQTTYTPHFLGLSQPNGLWNTSYYGEGMIIGVVDSGITPNHPSFRGDGMPPPPNKWKGRCDLGPPGCNYKHIGATAFLGGPGASPVDEHGHGTHVTGIAAGRAVDNAEVIGQARGTAVGMAPGSHIATYRVLDRNNGGLESDVIAGMDQAIGDGVDVLSLSLGAFDQPMHESIIAIASFSAIERGIVPSCAAMNRGPFPGLISNDAPWCLTVGASTVDRRITSTVVLGNGREINGETGFQPDFNSSVWWPIAYPGLNAGDDTANCKAGALPSYVQGTIVVCLTGGDVAPTDKGQNVRDAGGVAMILINRDDAGYTTSDDPHVLPVSNVGFVDGGNILSYLRNTTNPVARISFEGTQFGARPTPAVASFSSRGPSVFNGAIIKPDIIAPGVNILAAWPWQVGPFPTTSTFNFLSGTSMATPHVSGIVAMLKKNHPTWSAAAIKSAIMTTAYVLDSEGNRITDEFNGATASFFAMGSGHIDPNKANDPGLVYDLQPNDYIPYLCGLYPAANNLVEVIVRKRVDCSLFTNIVAAQLNYPSVAVTLGPYRFISIKRTVTYVGNGASYYTPYIEAPNGVTVVVDTPYLSFSSQNEQRSFQITITTGSTWSMIGQISEGFLSWVSDAHVVRSPISVTFA